MHRSFTKNARTIQRLSALVLAPLALGLWGCGANLSDFGGNETGAGKSELHGNDASGDQVCSEDPDATGIPEVDIIALDIEGSGDVVVTTTFNGDIEAWYAQQIDKLPFSLQFWTWNETYIEVFFKDKNAMKVADHKIDVLDFEFSGNKLIITLAGIDVENIKSATVSTFLWSYGNWEGSCDDELEVTP